MSIYLKSRLIKEKRKECGYSREELSGGICDVSTLKRYENNGMTPNNRNYRQLQEKLGGNPEQLVFSYDVNFFCDIGLYEEYEKLLIKHEYDRVAGKVSIIKRGLVDSTSIEAKQFLGRIELLKSQLPQEERKAKLEALLRESVPDFEGMNFSIARIYNETELNLLNDIATTYSECGDRNTALQIYKRIAEYYDCSIDNSESITLTKILINYSNMLGQDKKYNEALKVCGKCIKIMKNNSTQHLLYNVLFNYGWLFYHIGISQTDKIKIAKAKEYIEMSLALGRHQNESHSNLEIIKDFYSKMND